jgi:hypothetical protein
MRVATLFFTILAAASTITFAAPVPASAPAVVPAPFSAAKILALPALAQVPPTQDLQSRSFWGSIKKAASGVSD